MGHSNYYFYYGNTSKFQYNASNNYTTSPANNIKVVSKDIFVNH